MKLMNVLNKLMEDQGLSLDKLSKLTGISRSNINRMRTDPDSNPTIMNLLPIAKFFKISVEQLIGEKAVIDSHKYELNSLKIEKLPILKTYEQIVNFTKENLSPKKIKYTYAENPVSEKAFGYIVTNDSMQPIFPKGIIVIFDVIEHYENNSFILATLNNEPNKLYFRKYIDEGGLKFLTTLNNNSKTPSIQKVDDNISIIATAIECHMDLLK